MGATLKDVARMAGVSFTLVSKYLNHDPAARMSQETQSRIDAALAALSYRPSAAGRNLRRGRSQIIGMVCGDLTNLYFAHAADYALKACQRLGYQLLIGFEDGDDPGGSLRTLTSRGVDGIYGLSLPALPAELSTPNCPLLLNNSSQDGCSTVSLDVSDALDLALGGLNAAEIEGLFVCSPYWRRAFESSCARTGKRGCVHEMPYDRQLRRKQLQSLCAQRPEAIFSNGWETLCDLMEMLEDFDADYRPQLILHANCHGPFLGDPRIAGVVQSSSTALIDESLRLLLARIEGRCTDCRQLTLPARYVKAGSAEYAGLVTRHFHLT